MLIATDRLSVRTDFLGAAISFAVALFVLLRTDVDGALAGFVLSYAITLQMRLMWVARLSGASTRLVRPSVLIRGSAAELQINMNSVERVQEYLEIEHEPMGGIKPSAAWPSREGELVFEGVSARYDESLPPVLKDVTFTVRPKGERRRRPCSLPGN
jgi:ABC-type multidrug transport system fused ATPase/permease subunit